MGGGGGEVGVEGRGSVWGGVGRGVRGGLEVEIIRLKAELSLSDLNEPTGTKLGIRGRSFMTPAFIGYFGHPFPFL